MRVQYCARPGHSEHQSGLAIDIFTVSNQERFLAQPDQLKYFTWLQENAHLHGFHNTYQKGVEIDGYHEEPWHWRYLGLDLATELYENEMSFAEFFGMKE